MNDKVFVKNGNLSLNGIYLVANEVSVYHKEFVDAQKRAEWVITFAKLAKGKDFKGKVADSLEAVKAEVNNQLSNKSVSYLSAPEVSKGKLQAQLAAEALIWIEGNEKLNKVEKVNAFLQEFNIIHKYEKWGLHFERADGGELNKIYTIDEIVTAVQEVIDLV